MKANNIISMNRFVRLARHKMLHSTKSLSIGMAALFGALCMIHLINYPTTLVGSVSSLNNSQNFTLTFFYLGFFIYSLVLFATSFSSLRQKEKTIQYLQLPASVFEKFILELLRVIVPVMLYPILYYISFEFIALIVESSTQFITVWHIFDDIQFYKPANFYDIKRIETTVIFFLIATAFMFSIFVGNSIFTSKPFIKTTAIIAGFIGLFVGMTYLFTEWLQLDDYIYPTTIINIGVSIAVPITVILLFSTILITATFFNLKEKEV